jgi:iron(III) transport system substrate-binding protein
MKPLSRRSILSLAGTSAALLALPTARAATTAVTVYTAGPAGLARQLAAGFQKRAGLEVKLFQATTGQIMARLAAEKANPQADVLISASWDTAVDLAAQGELLAHTSPNAAQVPAALKHSHYVAQGAAALAIVWNPRSGKPRPQDWSDLATPEYRDLVTMPDPATSGSAYGLLSGLLANNAYGWPFFERLKANGLVIAGANAQALNPVMQGAKAAVFGAVDYISLGAQAQGEQIEVIYPRSGTVLEARPAMILKSARQVEGARKFIDYLLTDEAQGLVATTYMLPARQDIAARRPGWKDVPLLPEQSGGPSRAETLARFKATMGSRG